MKKKLFILITVAAPALTLLSSCGIDCIDGSGNVVTDVRKVDNFTKIDIGGGYKVILKQDSSMTVAVTIDDNLQEEVETSVSGGVLKVKSEHNICDATEAVLTIGVASLEGIDASGAIELQSEGTLNVKDLNLDLSGAGKVNLALNAANVYTEASGSSELMFSGQATSHKVDISGSGKLTALDFVVGSYSIETSGASECKINVLNSLTVNTSGASSIEYKGNPSNVVNHESGASSIKKID